MASLRVVPLIVVEAFTVVSVQLISKGQSIVLPASKLSSNARRTWTAPGPASWCRVEWATFGRNHTLPLQNSDPIPRHVTGSYLHSATVALVMTGTGSSKGVISRIPIFAMSSTLRKQNQYNDHCQNQLSLYHMHLANTMWAYVTMEREPGAGMLMRELEGRTEAFAGTFKTQEVANTMWSNATMGKEPWAGMMSLLG